MAKLKRFRKSIKNPFKKQSLATIGNADDEQSNASVSTSGNSLNSEIRYAGPIDVDTVRKHKRNKKKNKRAEISSLAKIVESRSPKPDSEVPECPREGRGSRSTTPVSQINGRWTPPLSAQELALKLAKNESTGAETVSTVNLLASYLMPSLHGSSDPGRSRSLQPHSEYYSSSLENTRSCSPSILGRIHKRERSSTPNSLGGISTATPMAENTTDDHMKGYDKSKQSPTCIAEFASAVDSQGKGGNAQPRPPPQLPLQQEKSKFSRPPTPAAKKKKKSINTKPKASNKEFEALKKGAEKNEFKKIELVKKNEGANGAGTDSMPFKEATKMSKMEPQKVIEVQACPKKKLQSDPPSSKEQVPIDPPGVDATNTRSESPFCTSSLTSFPQYAVKTDGPMKTSDVVPVDVIQSFSFDQDLSEDYSLSDSCSYISDMESIGEISICEETTRLIEAHRRYVKDSLTNKKNPSRQKPSIMKVGSMFKRSMQPSSDDESTTIMTEERKKLTWYDDEENWSKPFTLRTDETFDMSTVTTDSGGVQRIIRYNGLDQFFDGFIKEVSKLTCFDPVGEQEI